MMDKKSGKNISTNQYMINPNEKFPEREVKEFEALAPGIYQCELTDIELKDSTNFDGEAEKQYSFEFTVIEEGDYYGRKLWGNASQKFVGGSKPSNLFKIISGVVGKDFTKDESRTAHEWLNPGYFNALIGRQNLLAVSQKEKTSGGKKNVIDSILPVKEALPAYDPALRQEQ